MKLKRLFAVAAKRAQLTATTNADARLGACTFRVLSTGGGVSDVCSMSVYNARHRASLSLSTTLTPFLRSLASSRLRARWTSIVQTLTPPQSSPFVVLHVTQQVNSAATFTVIISGCLFIPFSVFHRCCFCSSMLLICFV